MNQTAENLRNEADFCRKSRDAYLRHLAPLMDEAAALLDPIMDESARLRAERHATHTACDTVQKPGRFTLDSLIWPPPALPVI